jgi:hypothetical protein
MYISFGVVAGSTNDTDQLQTIVECAMPGSGVFGMAIVRLERGKDYLRKTISG